MNLVGRRYDDQGDCDDDDDYAEDDDDDDVDVFCKNPFVSRHGQTTAALLSLLERESLRAPSWRPFVDAVVIALASSSHLTSYRLKHGRSGALAAGSFPAVAQDGSSGGVSQPAARTTSSVTLRKREVIATREQCLAANGLPMDTLMDEKQK